MRDFLKKVCLYLIVVALFATTIFQPVNTYATENEQDSYLDDAKNVAEDSVQQEVQEEASKEAAGEEEVSKKGTSKEEASKEEAGKEEASKEEASKEEASKEEASIEGKSEVTKDAAGEEESEESEYVAGKEVESEDIEYVAGEEEELKEAEHIDSEESEYGFPEGTIILSGDYIVDDEVQFSLNKIITIPEDATVTITSLAALRGSDNPMEWPSIDLNGGAIINKGSLKINGFTIENGKGYRETGRERAGGAIYNYDKASLEVKGRFVNNKATYGGVIYNVGKLYIDADTSLFINNSANEGGVIYNDFSGEVTIQGSQAHKEFVAATFENNEAIDNGGAIYNSGKINVQFEATLKNNRSLNGKGGSIYNFGTILEEEVPMGESADLCIADSKAVYGGGLYNDRNGTIIYGDRICVESSKASDKGGGIFNDGQITVNNISISDNEAVGEFGCGGGVYNDCHGGIWISSTKHKGLFSNNKATYAGGGLYNVGSFVFSKTNTNESKSNEFIFRNNTSRFGAGIYNTDEVEGYDYCVGDVSIEQVVMIDNSASELGGAVYNNGKFRFSGQMNDNHDTRGGDEIVNVHDGNVALGYVFDSVMDTRIETESGVNCVKSIDESEEADIKIYSGYYNFCPNQDILAPLSEVNKLEDGRYYVQQKTVNITSIWGSRRGYSTSKWMSYIDGETKLTELTIPGTHDTGTFNVSLRNAGDLFAEWTALVKDAVKNDKKWYMKVIDCIGSGVEAVFLSGVADKADEFAQTQDLTITQQLENGIRALDLRCIYDPDVVEGKVFLAHGHNTDAASAAKRSILSYYCLRQRAPKTNTDDNLLLLDDALREVEYFLRRNPSETVFLNIQPANGSADTPLCKEALDVIEKYSSNIIKLVDQKQARETLLNECRGKMIWLRLPAERGDYNDFHTTREKKLAQMDRVFKAAKKKGESDFLHVTYTSNDFKLFAMHDTDPNMCSFPKKLYVTVREEATYMKEHFLNNHPFKLYGEDKAYGLIMLDFPSTEFVWDCINVNSSYVDMDSIKIHTVKYDYCGGVSGPKAHQVMEGNTVTVSNVIPEAKSVNENCRFKYWSTNRSGKDGIHYNPGDNIGIIKSDITLYAVWDVEGEFNVEYELNGGTLSEDAITSYTYIPDSEDDSYFNENGGLPVANRKGYAFVGWYSDEDCRKEVNYIQLNTVGDKKYYAKWSPVVYKIYYNLGGVDAKLSDNPKISYTVEDKDRELPTVVDIPKDTQGHPLYEFVGWTYYRFQNNGVLLNIPTNECNDIVISAIWKDKTHKIKYVFGIDEVKAEHIDNDVNTIAGYDFNEFVSGSTVKLSAPKWISSDKTKDYGQSNFVKWSSIPYEQNGGSAVYPFTGAEAMDMVQDGELHTDNDDTEDITLYAYWTKGTPGVINDKSNYSVDKATYDIHYALETGSLTDNDPLVVYRGEKIQLSKPIRKGYRFRNWCVITEGNNAAILMGNEIPAGIKSDIRLEALWEPEEYSITYNTNTGMNNDKNPSHYSTDEQIVFYPATLHGFNFLGWFKEGSDVPVTKIEKGTTGEVVLYARWEMAEYDIEYDYNLPSGISEAVGQSMIIPNNPTKYNVYSDTIELRYPSLIGYEFAGWHWDASGESNKIISISNGSVGDIKLYGSWRKKYSDDYHKYSITYVTLDKNDESMNDMDNPTGYNSWDSIELKPAIWKAVSPQMYFKGWYLDSDYTQPVHSINSDLEGDITLYARWDESESYTIYFNPGEKGFKKEVSVEPGTTLGSVLSDLDAKGQGFAVAGYDTPVWYTSKSQDSVNVFESERSFTQDEILYAKYTPIEYNISYNLYDGEYTSSDGQCTNNNPDKYTVEEDVTLRAPVPEGNALFGGWYTDAERTKNISVINWKTVEQIEGDTITLYAKWDKSNKISVTFNINEQAGWDELRDPDVLEVAYGETISKYNAPEGVVDVPGYKIWGWYLTPECTGRMWRLGEDPVTCDCTLYAKWVPITYALTYELDGGDNSVNNPNTYTFESSEIILNDPVRRGFEFAGWYSDEDFENAITHIEAGSIGDKVIYAKWNPVCEVECENNITYIYTGGAIKPGVEVVYGDTVLVAGKDYSVAYSNNTNAFEYVAGTESKAPRVVVTSKKRQFDKKYFYFTIQQKDITDDDISVGDIAPIVADRKVHKPNVTISRGSKKLRLNTDYTVAYYTADDEGNVGEPLTNPKEPGVYYAKFTGKKQYKGDVYKRFVIYENTYRYISKVSVKGVGNRKYTGNVEKPSVDDIIIKYGKQLLVNGDDYTISFSPENPVACGTVTVTISGKGSYVGTKVLSYKITGTDINKAAVSGFERTIAYDGNPKKQSSMFLTYGKGDAKVVLNGTSKEAYEAMSEQQKLKQSYYYEYSRNTNVGTARITIYGVSGFTGKMVRSFSISQYDIGRDNRYFCKFKLDTSEYAYNKKAIKPLPTVVYRGQTLVLNKDYTISYRNNTKPYMYEEGQSEFRANKAPAIIIKGKGNFKGTKTLYFTIQQ